MELQQNAHKFWTWSPLLIFSVPKPWRIDETGATISKGTDEPRANSNFEATTDSILIPRHLKITE
jgi:hypothetical protein